jgi:transcriptional regulator with XRE-family HTH domain
MARPAQSRSKAKKAPARTVKSPTDIDREVGKRLRALREEAGISQTALGDGSGITFQQVQKYENGVNRVSVSRLLQFCDVLRVPISQVLDGIATSHQPKADPLQALRSGYGVRLAQAWDRLNPKTQGAMLKLIEESAN